MPPERTPGSDPTPSSPTVADADAPSAAVVAAVTGLPTRYVVLGPLGQGGMGVVLRAYDSRLQREVALKVVRSADSAGAGSQRMVAEARAMARLTHPNVVEVYDVDELDDGRVVLAMEYVAGMSLDRVLQKSRPEPHRVRELFYEAARGLQAAHDAGLLHRDFKPANVLVGDGVVKVTDFGLAKQRDELSEGGGAPSKGDRDDPGLTTDGSVMGTPRYMAPEQHRGEPLGPAADQYAFCVALWEALCGAPPFPGPALAEVKNDGPPPWPDPSTPRSLVQAIRRGLSVRPAARWPSMRALGNKVRPSSSRFGPWLLGLGLVAGAGLLAASIAPPRDRCAGGAERVAKVWNPTRDAAGRDAFAKLGRTYATQTWSQASGRLEAYAGDWADAHRDACEAAADSPGSARAVLDSRMMCLERARTELGAVADQLVDADDLVARRTQNLLDRLPPLSRCSDLEALLADIEPPLPDEAAAVASFRTRLAAANAAEAAGRYDQARALTEELESELPSLQYGPLRAELYLTVAAVAWALSEVAEAEGALRRAYRHALAHRQRKEIFQSTRFLSFAIGTQPGRWEEGKRYVRLARALDTDDPVGVSLSAAMVDYSHGDYAAAESELRGALGRLEDQGEAESFDATVTRGNLANALQMQGKIDEAEVENRRALQGYEDAFGPEHPAVGMMRNNLGNVLFAAGRFAEAEAEQREAIRLRTAALGRNNADVATSRNNFANALHRQGKLEEAAAEHAAVLALRKKILEPGHADLAQSHDNLALVLRDVERLDEAEQHHRAALAILEAVGPRHPSTAQTRRNLAVTLTVAGKLAVARLEYREAIEIYDATLAEHEYAIRCRYELADVLLRMGKPQEARRVAEQFMFKLDRDGLHPMDRGYARFTVARVLWAAAPSQRARARKEARIAMESFEAAQQRDDLGADELEEVRQWLAAHR